MRWIQFNQTEPEITFSSAAFYSFQIFPQSNVTFLELMLDQSTICDNNNNNNNNNNNKRSANWCLTKAQSVTSLSSFVSPTRSPTTTTTTTTTTRGQQTDVGPKHTLWLHCLVSYLQPDLQQQQQGQQTVFLVIIILTLPYTCTIYHILPNTWTSLLFIII